jgi:hypothetical protein
MAYVCVKNYSSIYDFRTKKTNQNEGLPIFIQNGYNILFRENNGKYHCYISDSNGDTGIFRCILIFDSYSDFIDLMCILKKENIYFIQAL